MANRHDNKEASNIEKFKTVNKNWCKVDDVIVLVGCSKSKAYKLMAEVNKIIIEQGYKPLQSGTVPMEDMVKHLQISKTAIYKAALQEKEIFGTKEAI